MNKLLLSIAALAASISVSGQVIYSQTFDGVGGPTAGGPGTYTFPSGFLLRNVDNRTPATNVNYVNDAWERREDFINNVSDSAAFSTSWYTPAGTANDWMWTPLIGPLPANAVLSWNALAPDVSYPDGYEVRIMIAPTTPTGGTGVIGNQITNSTVLASIAAENSTWTARNVNLNTYAGQSVYIGFRNNSTDQFILLIDDIQVAVPLSFDAELVSIDTLTEYTQTPLPQVTPMNFAGDIRNNGSSPLTNVQLNVNVYNGANTVVYNAASTGTSLAAGATSSFTVAPYTPTVADAYVVEYYVSATETDAVTSNDTMYSYSIVTDTVYSRDDATVTGGLGIGAGNGGYLGQDFIINTADDLTSVSMYFTRGYTGKQFAAVIWDMAAGIPNSIIGGTDTLLYPDDSARFYTLPIHGGLLSLTPGRYAITAIEFDSTLSLGQTASIFTNGRTWVNWPTSPLGGWGNNEDFGTGFAKPYVLRANFGTVDLCAGFSVANGTISNVTCNGGSNGSISVNITGGTAPYTYMWSNGTISPSATNLPAGAYTYTVTDNNGCPSTGTANVNEPALITNSQNITLCAGQSVTVGSNTYNTTGVYTDVLTAANGCDSTVTTNLTVNSAIDVTTNTAGATVTANATGASYQWLDCDNSNAPIAGETNQSFTASVSGNYAVVVTVGSCSDTSACASVTLIGINQLSAVSDVINVFPNPNNGTFVLKAGYEGTYTLYNELGQVVKTIELNAKNGYSISIADLNQGVYTISGVTNNKVVNQKIVVKK